MNRLYRTLFVIDAYPNKRRMTKLYQADVRTSGIHLLAKGCLTAVYDVEKVGKIYMPTLRKRQDWGLWLTILKDCRVAYGMKEPLAIYRIHSASISRNKLSLVRYNLDVYKHVLRFSTLKSYFFFTFLFLPSYFFKKLMQSYMNR